MRRFLKNIYLFLGSPFFKNGLPVNIGGAGRFRFDYAFRFSGFGEFGARHNSGFRKWIEACRGKSCVFDVGAHIGLYSIPASPAVGSGGRIYAFEPSSANLSYLERHMRFNNIENIEPVPYLVGENSKDGVTFFESRRPDAMNSVKVRKNAKLYDEVLKKQISLDDFCAERGVTPKVVKIDVEGSEIEVLKGARETLRNGRPKVFLSVHPRTLELMGYSVEELMSLVRELGYSMYDAAGNEVESREHNEYILVPSEEIAEPVARSSCSRAATKQSRPSEEIASSPTRKAGALRNDGSGMAPRNDGGKA